MTRARGVRSRPGWTRLSAPGDKLSALWRHDATGWVVRHCGHPTANWPYYAIDPEKVGVVVHSNGYAFRTLELAMIAVDSVVASRARLVYIGIGVHGDVYQIHQMEVASDDA